MKLEFTRTAIKGLRKMPADDSNRLIARLEQFAKDGSGDVKKMTGRPEYRLRSGDWRAIFTMDADMIVVRVAHRREIYR